MQPHEPASRPVPRFIAQGQRNENQAVSRLRSTKSRREVPKIGHWTSCCRATSGTSCSRNLGVIDRILNEWCASFVSSEIEWVAPFDESWGCERADCGLSFYPSCSAILRRRGPHSVRYRAGEGASKGCCSKRGHFLATPTSARNAPSATPGDRARARHCVSGLFCVRDDPAEIAGCQLRRFV